MPAEQNIVIFQSVAIGQQALKVRWTIIDLKEPVARAAKEVMVVTFWRRFPTGRFANAAPPALPAVPP